MIDLDGVIYAPYIKGEYGGPLMLIEFKPENALQDFWVVTRQLARKADLPAARIIEESGGGYTVHVATSENDYQPIKIGTNLTVEDWFSEVELPLRMAAGHRTPVAA